LIKKLIKVIEIMSRGVSFKIENPHRLPMPELNLMFWSRSFLSGKGHRIDRWNTMDIVKKAMKKLIFFSQHREELFHCRYSTRVTLLITRIDTQAI